MQPKTNTSFPLIDSRHQPLNQKIAVLSAINKLKETEDKLLQAKKREFVQKRIEQSLMAKQEEKKRAEMLKKIVRRSFDSDKNAKQENILMREKEIQQLHLMASTLRENKFQFRQTMRSLQREESSKIYESTRNSRQRHEELIREFKQRQMQLKMQNRRMIAEREEKSREKVKQFKQSRISFIKKQREKDVKQLQKRISMKTRYLQQLYMNQSINFSSSRSAFKQRSKSAFNDEANASHDQISSIKAFNFQSSVQKPENLMINKLLDVNPEDKKEAKQSTTLDTKDHKLEKPTAQNKYEASRKVQAQNQVFTQNNTPKAEESKQVNQQTEQAAPQTTHKVQKQQLTNSQSHKESTKPKQLQKPA